MGTMGPVSIRTRSATPEFVHVPRMGAEVHRQPPGRADHAESLGELAAVGAGARGGRCCSGVRRTIKVGQAFRPDSVRPDPIRVRPESLTDLRNFPGGGDPCGTGARPAGRCRTPSIHLDEMSAKWFNYDYPHAMKRDRIRLEASDKIGRDPRDSGHPA